MFDFYSLRHAKAGASRNGEMHICIYTAYIITIQIVDPGSK